MNEELEGTTIDRNSPIWGGSGCNYFSLTSEINSYYTQYYIDKLNITDELLFQVPTEKEDIEKHNALVQQLEDGVFENIYLKTEEYFRVLWETIKEVGFKEEKSDRCIDTCDTLIREEVEWWKERTDLKKYKALEIPFLVEYHSWDVIWRLCKYEKLVAHPLHNYASKRQSVLKRNLPQKTTKKSISLNLETIQFTKLCESLKRTGAIDNAVDERLFKSYLNGSEFNSVITPIKFKNHSYTSVFIYLCEEYGLQAQKEYFKWQEFFGIEQNYAKKQISSYRNNHIGFPPYYNQMKDILEEIGCKKLK